MGLSKEKRSLLIKAFIFSISLVLALIAAQMILAIFVAILYIPYITSLPNFVEAAILLVGIIVAIWMSTLSYRSVSRYLKKNFR